MKKATFKILVLYTLFALLSIAINIISQIIFIMKYKEAYAVEISILVGTLAGLPLRYFLEKHYIFFFKSKNIKQDGQTFARYSFMGVITTAIFWVTEYAFHLIYDNAEMRYLGGVIGLAVGFVIKYHLDKRYVFVNKNNVLLL